MAVVQIAQEARRIFHIAPRVEHGFDRGEMLSMEMLVDLHAADVDENGAALPGALKAFERLLEPVEVIGLALDIHGIGLKAPLAPRLRQPH